MNKQFVCLFLAINLCFCDWVLEWSDEFDGNQLDLDKWNVTDGLKDPFESQFGEEIFSYSKNTAKNIMVTNGVLALNVFREDNQDRFFTAATINSLKSFLYGRLDIRAALPEGKLLQTMIVLLPKENHYGDGYVNGLIDMIIDLQRNEFYYSIWYGKNKNKQGAHIPRFQLKEFQNYSLEWNESQITWRLNDQAYFTFNISQNISLLYQDIGQPFDQEFYVSIRVLVYAVRKTLFRSANDYNQNWKCPSLLIDHVRFYRQANLSETHGQIQINKLQNAKMNKSTICESIKKQFYKVNVEQAVPLWKIIVPVSLFVFIFVATLVIIWIIKIRKRKANKQIYSTNRNKDQDIKYVKTQVYHAYFEILDKLDEVNNDDYDDVTDSGYDQVKNEL